MANPQHEVPTDRLSPVSADVVLNLPPGKQQNVSSHGEGRKGRRHTALHHVLQGGHVGQAGLKLLVQAGVVGGRVLFNYKRKMKKKLL